MFAHEINGWCNIINFPHKWVTFVFLCFCVKLFICIVCSRLSIRGIPWRRSSCFPQTNNCFNVDSSTFYLPSLTVGTRFSGREIPWENVIAFSSHNCSVMKGRHNSVLTRIKDVQPHVLDIGCICHLAKLCCQQGVKQLLLPVDEQVYHFAKVRNARSSIGSFWSSWFRSDRIGNGIQTIRQKRPYTVTLRMTSALRIEQAAQRHANKPRTIIAKLVCWAKRTEEVKLSKPGCAESVHHWRPRQDAR